MDERSETAAAPRPVDLGFCNGLGILMRARRRLIRRQGSAGRDLTPAISDRWSNLLSGPSLQRPMAGKIGAR
jgi:hypothetical protein